MDDRWELEIEGHKCVCELRGEMVHVTLMGRDFQWTRRDSAGADARATAVKLCKSILAERKRKH
jgi:hypothetical protein